MDIDAIDWASLEHAYGSAADVPMRWRALLSREEPEAWVELLHAVCHQGTVYSATAALAPLLMELAKSDHPASREALEILGAILNAHGGPLVSARLHGSMLAGMRDPLTGLPMKRAPRPKTRDIAAERTWIRAMQDPIEAELPRWLRCLSSADRDTRLAAAYLLAGVRRHPDAARAREAVRRAAEEAIDEIESARLEVILEDAESADE